jgi:hypothetical protein
MASKKAWPKKKIIAAIAVIATTIHNIPLGVGRILREALDSPRCFLERDFAIFMPSP